MSEQLGFLEIKYGKIYELDVHGLTLEEAKAEIMHTLNKIDVFIKGVLITHGYHKGTVLKDYIRNVLSHKSIAKMINVDASRTLLLINLS